jgi:hypothetical protein
MVCTKRATVSSFIHLESDFLTAAKYYIVTNLVALSEYKHLHAAAMQLDQTHAPHQSLSRLSAQ